MKFSAQVNRGTLKWDSPETLQAFLETLKGEVTVCIDKKKKTRTNPQNRLMWAQFKWLGKELGYLPEELHATFKAMFLVDRSSGLPVVRSTTQLSTKRFGEYLEAIARKCAEMGHPLPPKEYFNL